MSLSGSSTRNVLYDTLGVLPSGMYFSSLFLPTGEECLPLQFFCFRVKERVDDPFIGKSYETFVSEFLPSY